MNKKIKGMLLMIPLIIVVLFIISILIIKAPSIVLGVFIGGIIGTLFFKGMVLFTERNKSA